MPGGLPHPGQTFVWHLQVYAQATEMCAPVGSDGDPGASKAWASVQDQQTNSQQCTMSWLCPQSCRKAFKTTHPQSL